MGGEVGFEPGVELDRAGGVPLYRQISGTIARLITSGQLPAGTRIENEVAMAERLGVSRPTARRALQDLVARGLVVRRRGVGTQVASELIRRPVALTSLHEDLAAAGRAPRTEVLTLQTVAAEDTLAARLGLAAGTPLVRIERLRHADGEPLALLTNYLRPAVAPTAEQLAELGLYEVLRSAGVQLRLARQTIGARLATAAEARLLGERPRAALLTMERIAFDGANHVVEVGSHAYRASRYSFDTTLVAP